MIQALLEVIHILVVEDEAQKLTELTLTALLVNWALVEAAEIQLVLAQMVALVSSMWSNFSNESTHFSKQSC